MRFIADRLELVANVAIFAVLGHVMLEVMKGGDLAACSSGIYDYMVDEEEHPAIFS